MSSPGAEQPTPAVRLDAGYLESLFEHARLAIVACEPDGKLLRWNRAAGRLFPTLDAHGQGMYAADLFALRDQDIVKLHMQRCVETLDIQEFDWHPHPESPAPIVYGVWWTPVVDADGALTGLSLWFRDITQRVRLKRAVEGRQRLNVLGTLAGAVAHHYNNLLCSITTSLEYAGHMSSPLAMRKALQRTADAVNRASNITQQLLAFARVDHRERTYSDLTEAVLYYFDEHEREISDRNVQFEFEWRQVPICPVPREPFQVVLDNLVRNALEAMPDGGVLRVKLNRHDERHISIAISDSGGGIAAGAIEHLFEPFFTTKGVLGSGNSSNAGMGLAVVHGFVSEMGGFVTAGNLSGGGARFEIVLPVKGND